MDSGRNIDIYPTFAQVISSSGVADWCVLHRRRITIALEANQITGTSKKLPGTV